MLHVVWRDLTERRRLEAELVQAHKMEALGRLSSGIAHDFNNLLVGIIGHAELLLTDLGDRPDQQAGAAEILKAGRRAAALVGQLLAFSRKQMLRPQTIDLSATLADLADMLRRLLGEGISVVIEPGHHPLWVRADPGQITQVALNLAANARDAVRPGGRFRLALAAARVDERTPDLHDSLSPGPYVALIAEDDGEGIAPADLPRIFDPFFTTKPVGRGTGLGLATVYGIVRQSGGSIAVASAPGSGTRFSIYLPRVEPEAPKAEPRAGGAAIRPNGGEHVLLVDDEAATGRLVRVMLERAGYRVTVATGGADALEIIRRGDDRVDLLLSDIVMPGMDGVELVRRAREMSPGLPALLTSGYPAQFLAGSAGLTPAADLLQKPFSAQELVQRVAAVLRGAR
ncbi:response regulator [bacterium]|nr:response regulator [bacterium]